MTARVFARLALIGIGLIGGSIALAARRGKLVGHIAVSSRMPATLARAKALGLGDSFHADPVDAVRNADCVILCTPVGAVGAVTEAIASALKPGAIVSDVGSVKASVIALMKPHIPKGVHFVPAHPVAGTEYSGPEAAFAELFDNRWTILTPPEGTDPAAVEKLAAFWRGLGANVETMSAEHHDLVLAITSHVPHLIAYNIVGTAADLETVTRGEVMKFSAGGFRDFTRIAASDPTMWRDVFLNNRDAVLEVLDRFLTDFAMMREAIRASDGDTLFDLFSRTREIRRGIIELGQDDARPDFGRKHNGD